MLVIAFALAASGAEAEPSSRLTFQYLHPEFLHTEIAPAYWTAEPPNSPARYEPEHDDFRSQFISPSGKTVTIVVKAPVTASEYDLPPIAAGQTVNDYLNGAFYDGAGNPRSGTTIKIPRGTYTYDFPLNSNCTSTTDHQPKYVHWQLPEGATDLVVDGQGSTVNFSDFCLGLNLPSVNRVVFKNFTFAWPNLQIATVATVIAVGGDGTNGYTYDVKIDPADTLHLPPMLAAATAWDRSQGHWDLVNINDDVAYGDGVTSGVPLTCVEPPAEQHNTGCTARGIPSYGVNFKPGESVILRHVDFAVAVDISGQDISFDNITLQNLIGAGFVFGQGRGLRVTRSTLLRMADHPISGTGNAFLITAAVSGDIAIDHNSFAYQADDGFDMNTTIVRFTPTPAVNTTPMNTFTFDATMPTQLTWPSFLAPQPGDTIALFDNALAFKGLAKIAAVGNPAGPTSTLTLDRSIDAKLSAGAFIAGDLTSSAGARYEIDDNEFVNGHPRALLLQTPFGWVHDNFFAGQTQKQVYVLASLFWGEGAGAQELTISDNIFFDVGHGQDFTPLDVIAEAADFPNLENEVAGTNRSAPAINQNLVIARNLFASDRVAAAVNLSSVNDVVFSANAFLLTRPTIPSAGTGQYPFSIHDAANIYVDTRNIFDPRWLGAGSCAQSNLLALSSPAPPVAAIKPFACIVPPTTANVSFANQ